ncbi:SMC domain protein [Methanohalobium evestigatum Z-7303]|uniref:DNA double-strand break repair Rad50 ATPase n=1 Tax=Methanohalobium evestigatum (strain ATCC BAA-1072 / DSM 3721 / NBRC 107634 / OCM 161 / Z-7303) TaxID=644295 RepID=D7EAF7_METEZ|nr:AAA family ATPase [Methanohalobium evestigatum]ADI74956.1 SMC domain protein [Methanohalobium evestigatum Z-7303]
MKLKRLYVENIRSYEYLDLSFNNGVSVVSGANGSGKSSLLEAFFTGLFGSRTLSKEYVLADMIRKGASKASIYLELEQNGNEYIIEQGFRYDTKNDRAYNSKSVFKSNGNIVVDQATQTYDAVCKLLNMDEEAYRNCVYIRQGEIDILINATPKERQNMIDDLLQIGKLEHYRERASNAKKGVKRHLRDVDNRIKNTESEIEKIKNENPYENLNKLREKSKNIQSKIDELNQKKDSAKSKIDELNNSITTYSELEEKKKSINEEIQDFNTKKTQMYKDIEDIKADISKKRQYLKQLQDKNSELENQIDFNIDDIENTVNKKEEEERVARENLNTVSSNRAIKENELKLKNDTLKDIDKQITESNKNIQKKKESVESVQKEIENFEISMKEWENKKKTALENAISLGFTEDKLDNIDDTMELLNDQQKDLHGRERELQTSISEVEKRLNEHKKLLEKGKCPTCGQDLKNSSIEESTSEDEKQKKSLEEQLSKTREDLKSVQERLKKVKTARKYSKTINDSQNEIQIIQNKIESLKKQIEDYNNNIEEEKTNINELENRKKEVNGLIDELNKEILTLKQKEETAGKEHQKVLNSLDIVKNIRNNLNEYEKIQSDINQLEYKIKSNQDNASLLDSQITERRERLKEIKDKMGDVDIDGLRKTLKQYESAHQNITNEIDKLYQDKDSVLKEAGRLENEINRLNNLHKDLQYLENKKNYLNSVYEDSESLENMYMRIRANLREKNIKALDSLINEIFTFMYSNNAYSHIRLDSDYNFTIYEKDGTPLDPKLLSGGERAIFNLVLRCAIYRLLSYGVSNSSSSSELPPLILDEPTVFLDRGHIHQLIKLIDMMRDSGVGQILIVSHDESLIDSADYVYQVEKDPVTNTSMISAK